MANHAKPAVPAAPVLPALPIPFGAFLRKLGDRCLRAFAEWVAHAILLFGIFAVIQAFHWGLTHILGVPQNKVFFHLVEMEVLFDGADFALLVGVGVVGVTAVVRAYLGKHGV
jgi:hypothetical protein